MVRAQHTTAAEKPPRKCSTGFRDQRRLLRESGRTGGSKTGLILCTGASRWEVWWPGIGTGREDERYRQMQEGLGKYKGQCLDATWLWKVRSWRSQEWLPESWLGWWGQWGRKHNEGAGWGQHDYFSPGCIEYGFSKRLLSTLICSSEERT